MDATSSAQRSGASNSNPIAASNPSDNPQVQHRSKTQKVHENREATKSREIPPQDEDFYERLSRNRDNWRGYLKKAPEGLGIPSYLHADMVAKADSFLPASETIMFNTPATRAIRDGVAARLLRDIQLGQYFQRSFPAAKYPHAYKFFEQAAKKVVMVAAWARRDKARRVSSNSRDEENASDSDEPISSKRARNKAEHDKEAFSKRPRPTDTSRPAESQVKKASPNMDKESVATTSDKAQDAPTPSAFHILGKAAVPKNVEIMSLQHGHPVQMSMVDMFKCEGTPQPSEVNITAVRAGCQRARKRRGLPAIPDDQLNFMFFWTEDNVDKEMEVMGDASLRDAYRVWLAAGDVDVPFVLSVDDVNVVGAWVKEEMLK